MQHLAAFSWTYHRNSLDLDSCDIFWQISFHYCERKRDNLGEDINQTAREKPRGGGGGDVQPIAQGILSGWQLGLSQGLDYYLGAILEMYQKLDNVICTDINVLKPAPISGLLSTSPSSNQDFLSQGSPMRIIKSRENNMKSYFLLMRHPLTFPPKKEPIVMRTSRKILYAAPYLNQMSVHLTSTNKQSTYHVGCTKIRDGFSSIFSQGTTDYEKDVPIVGPANPY